MALPSNIVSQSASISAGASVSPAINCAGHVRARAFDRCGWSAAKITFQSSIDGATYLEPEPDPPPARKLWWAVSTALPASSYAQIDPTGWMLHTSEGSQGDLRFANNPNERHCRHVNASAYTVQLTPKGTPCQLIPSLPTSRLPPRPRPIRLQPKQASTLYRPPWRKPWTRSP